SALHQSCKTLQNVAKRCMTPAGGLEMRVSCGACNMGCRECCIGIAATGRGFAAAVSSKGYSREPENEPTNFLRGDCFDDLPLLLAAAGGGQAAHWGFHSRGDARLAGGGGLVGGADDEGISGCGLGVSARLDR